MGRVPGYRPDIHPARQAAVERLCRALQPDGTERVAGFPHFQKHRGGLADCHRMALVLQQRASQHGQWRHDTRPETENGRVNSTTQPPQKLGDYRNVLAFPSAASAFGAAD